MKWIVITAALLILLVTGGIIYLATTAEEGTFIIPGTTKSSQNTPENPSSIEGGETNLPPSEKADGETSVTSSGGGGGGGGGGGTTNEDTETQTPPQQTCGQVAYSLTNPLKQEICQTYDGQICTQKQVTCGIDAKNLDIEATGEFEIEISLTPTQNTSEVIAHFEQTKTVSPQEKETFTQQFTVTSTEAQGNANTESTCFYNTIRIPQALC